MFFLHCWSSYRSYLFLSYSLPASLTWYSWKRKFISVFGSSNLLRCAWMFLLVWLYWWMRVSVEFKNEYSSFYISSHFRSRCTLNCSRRINFSITWADLPTLDAPLCRRFRSNSSIKSIAFSRSIYWPGCPWCLYRSLLDSFLPQSGLKHR